LLEAGGGFGGEDSSGGGSVEGDVLRLVGFEQLFVDVYCVVDRGGEGMLGSEAVEDGDDLGLREVGDGDAFGEGAGVGVEPSAVNADEDAVAFSGGDGEGREDF
jgi:hypothetical protein